MNVTNLVQHMLTHYNDRRYECHDCSYKCTGKYALKQHVKRVHVKKENTIEMKRERLRLVREKMKSERMKRESVQEMEKTKRKPKEKNPQTKCDVCGKTFLWHSQLVRHMRTHSKPVCKVCNQQFTRSSDLKTHELLFEHGGSKEESSGDR